MNDDVKDQLFLKRRFLVAFIFVLVLLVVDWRFGSLLWLAKTLLPVRKETYGALATIFGALLGFAITAYSVVVSLNDSIIMRRLRGDNRVGGLTADFVKAIFLTGFATLASLGGLVVDSGPDPRIWLEYFVLFVSVWASLGVVGIVFVLEALLGAINTAQSQREVD